jgi:hypothetical protein
MVPAMNTPPRGIPLRPHRSARAEAAVQSLVRACILRALAERGDRNMFAQREREWRDDYDLGLILRAAVGPASTDSAAALVTVAVALVSILTPVSAAAALLQRALPLTFEGSMGSISVPSISPPAVGFIAEGAPMPMLTAPTGPGATLLPYKLAASVSFTDEMLRGSNAEVVAPSSGRGHRTGLGQCAVQHRRGN